MEHLLQDLRYTVRTFRRTPGFAVAILTIAVGVGASAAIFSVVNAVLLRPLPFTRPNDLVLVTEGKLDDAKVAYREVASAFDKAAKVGVIKKEKASRKRSRLQIRLNGAAAPVAPAK